MPSGSVIVAVPAPRIGSENLTKAVAAFLLVTETSVGAVASCAFTSCSD